MGTYKKYSKYSTTIHTYEFNPKEERFAYEYGVLNKLETINKIPKPKTDEETVCSVNFNFFDWSGKNNNGYGEIERDGVQIKEASPNYVSFSFKDNKVTLGDLPNATIGAGVGLVLILNGKIDIRNKAGLQGINAKDARTAFGQKANGNIVIVVAEGDDTKKKGVTSTEMAKFLLSLGVIIGFQGDCGGSSSMIVNGMFIYNQGRAIACGLVVYKKKATKKDIRVVTAKTSLNIRAKGSLLGKVVGSYPCGTAVEVLEEVGLWCRTNKGWVSIKYLAKN